MPNVPYPYLVNGKLVTGNGSLIPISSLSNRSLLPSSTLPSFFKMKTGDNQITFVAFQPVNSTQSSFPQKIKRCYKIYLFLQNVAWPETNRKGLRNMSTK